MIIENNIFLFSKIMNVNNGDTFRNCNMMQANPNTSICEGKSGLTFENCNLCNCSVPEDSIIIGCMVAQIDKCTNLHPDLADIVDSPCVESCRHLTEKETVTIDGVEIIINRIYQDIVLGP